jgi:hypothetical protein
MRVLVTAATLIALCPAAYAWTTDPQPTNVTADPSARAGALSTSSSRSSSAALSNSSARAVSSQSQIQGQSLRNVNRNNVTVNNNGSGSNGSGGSGVDPATLATLEAGHGGWGSGLPAASAYAPSFSTMNPCTGPAASLGAQFQLFGISVGGQEWDRVCQLIMLHQPAAALEYLCDADSEVRHALARTGSPCIADRQASATPVNDNPQPPAPVQHPAWCKRARPTTEASRVYYQEQCGS